VAILQHAEEVTASVAMICRYYRISTKPTTATAAPKAASGDEAKHDAAKAETAANRSHSRRDSRPAGPEGFGGFGAVRDQILLDVGVVGDRG
jgi:hypothetical protein